MSKVLFQTDYIELRYDKDKNLLSTEWLTPSTKEEYRYAMNFLFECYLKYKPQNLLIDTRKHGVLSEENQAWFARRWSETRNPDVSHYSAILLPRDLLEKMMITETIGKLTPDKVENTRMFFDNEIDALQWFDSLKNEG